MPWLLLELSVLSLQTVIDMLHLIFQSPIQLPVLERIAADDDIVFLESSVLSLLVKGSLQAVLVPMLVQNKFYVLLEDIEIRGIRPTELVSGIQVIDYEALVNLTVKNPHILTWT